SFVATFSGVVLIARAIDPQHDLGPYSGVSREIAFLIPIGWGHSAEASFQPAAREIVMVAAKESASRYRSRHVAVKHQVEFLVPRIRHVTAETSFNPTRAFIVVAAGRKKLAGHGCRDVAVDGQIECLVPARRGNIGGRGRRARLPIRKSLLEESGKV